MTVLSILLGILVSAAFTLKLIAAMKAAAQTVFQRGRREAATEAYPWGTSQGGRTTENEAGRQFQPPLVEALADFGG